MKGKYFRYLIVVVCVVAILFALFKVLSPGRKKNTYLALGDYLSVSGELKGENITSFSNLLGEYFIAEKIVNNFNDNYTSSGVDSALLLEMISKETYGGKDEGLVSLIKDSKYITISVGMNDILQYIRFDARKQDIVYDKEYIERRIEILKHNYYEIIEGIREINENTIVYLMGYYYPFTWVEEENREKVNEVFEMLNGAISEVSKECDVYYVDISEVSKDENMFSKYQIYLNQLGHEYVFSVFRSNYLN